MEVFERHIVNDDGLTLIFIAIALIFGILNKVYAEQFILFLRIPVSNAYFRVQRKSKSILNGFNTVMSFGGALIVSLTAYLYFHATSNFDGNSFEWVFFSQILIGYTSFLILKCLVDKIISEVFSFSAFMDKYLTFKLGVRNFSTMVIIPLLALAVYFTNFNFSFLLVIILGFLGFQVILLMGFYVKKRQIITRFLFYFILYLCTFEIAPYFILYKLLN